MCLQMNKRIAGWESADYIMQIISQMFTSETLFWCGLKYVIYIINNSFNIKDKHDMHGAISLLQQITGFTSLMK